MIVDTDIKIKLFNELVIIRAETIKNKNKK
jgi:hypothetical protein